MITIQVAGCECAVDQAERSYSTLLSQIASHRNTGSIAALNAGVGDGLEWWANFHRHQPDPYSRLREQARELRDEHDRATSAPCRTSDDLFVWKMAFEEAFTANNMEWVEGTNPYLSTNPLHARHAALPVPGYLAYDAFTTKVPVMATQQLLERHESDPRTPSDIILRRSGLKGRESLRQSREGRREWRDVTGTTGSDMVGAFFTRLRERVGMAVGVEDAPQEPQTYGFTSLEAVKLALRSLIVEHSDHGRTWCIPDTNEWLVKFGLSPMPGVERDADPVQIADYIKHFEEAVTARRSSSGAIVNRLKEYNAPLSAAPLAGEEVAVAAHAVAAELTNEMCTPIRVRDFLIELSEQTANEGIVNEWLDQLGLTPYHRRFSGQVTLNVSVAAATPDEASALLREATWEPIDSLDPVEVHTVSTVSQLRQQSM